MINVSPIGRGCSLEERDAFEIFDKKHQIRPKFIEALKSKFPDFNLTFSIGNYIEEAREKRYQKNKPFKLASSSFPLILLLLVGGQISFDIFPVGWDKTYALDHLKEENFETIHFFGDKTMPGGNDYEIANHKLVTSHPVKDPNDTIKQLKELFPELAD